MEASILERLRITILTVSSWLFLLLALVLFALLLKRTVSWLRARAKAGAVSSRIVQVRLRLRPPDGAWSLHTFHTSTIMVASFGSPDLFLPVSAGAAIRRYGFRIVLRETPQLRAFLESDFALLVNGVPRRQKELKPGDRIVFGAYRVEFQEAAIQRLPSRLPPRPAIAWLLPGIAVSMVFGLIFLQPLRRASAPEPPAAAVTEPIPEPAEQVAEVQREPARSAVPAPVPKAARPAAPAPKPARISKSQPTAARREPTAQAEVRMVAPGEELGDCPVDILFFHAHPDDESLAFGVMMAAASRAGKSLAAVLFTDGEAGKDLYPRRAVGGMYPHRRLQGKELAEVRVREACAALAILGCRVYVRLGLENRPYNGLHDEVGPEEVIAAWGGEEELVAELERIMRAFRPRIVISPASDSGAREHFEHKAVGILVAEAVASLRGEGFIYGHLVPVDPLSRERYTALVEVNGLARDGESGLTFRQIQNRALRAHVSQRDASVVGARFLARQGCEYYRSLDWELEESLAQYLALPPEREQAAAF